MSATQGARPSGHPRSFFKSFWALLAGFLMVVLLSIGTDLALHFAGVLPALEGTMSNSLFVLVTIYRVIYGILGGYITARLAPFGPMGHALVGGVIGLILNIVGAVATWNHLPSMGPHWYPVALTLTAMPCAWLGGKLRLMQMVPRS
ncbi:MAG TPA: hypothetical protein VLX32_12685 [Candidatus Acidoferrum sp.]|nr:hypothetical protein [Candidatus Acidoferrum sp.]